MTIVIFRKDNGGEVTACFPLVRDSDLPSRRHLRACYSHVGRHGAYSLAWYATTKPARHEEYAPLLAELVSIGHDDLSIRRRRTA